MLTSSCMRTTPDRVTGLREQTGSSADDFLQSQRRRSIRNRIGAWVVGVMGLVSGTAKAAPTLFGDSINTMNAENPYADDARIDCCYAPGKAVMTFQARPASPDVPDGGVPTVPSVDVFETTFDVKDGNNGEVVLVRTSDVSPVTSANTDFTDGPAQLVNAGDNRRTIVWHNQDFVVAEGGVERWPDPHNGGFNSLTSTQEPGVVKITVTMGINVNGGLPSVLRVRAGSSYLDQVKAQLQGGGNPWVNRVLNIDTLPGKITYYAPESDEMMIVTYDDGQRVYANNGGNFQPLRADPNDPTKWVNDATNGKDPGMEQATGLATCTTDGGRTVNIALVRRGTFQNTLIAVRAEEKVIINGQPVFCDRDVVVDDNQPSPMAPVDIDADGIPDYQDQCATAANPTQVDLDNNGTPDACDLQFSVDPADETMIGGERFVPKLMNGQVGGMGYAKAYRDLRDGGSTILTSNPLDIQGGNIVVNPGDSARYLHTPAPSATGNDRLSRQVTFPGPAEVTITIHEIKHPDGQTDGMMTLTGTDVFGKPVTVFLDKNDIGQQRTFRINNLIAAASGTDFSVSSTPIVITMKDMGDGPDGGMVVVPNEDGGTPDGGAGDAMPAPTEDAAVTPKDEGTEDATTPPDAMVVTFDRAPFDPADLTQEAPDQVNLPTQETHFENGGCGCHVGGAEHNQDSTTGQLALVLGALAAFVLRRKRK